MSGWQDSNLRPPAPKAGAIPGYATPRNGICFYWSILITLPSNLVGVAGFEPTTSCSQSRRDTGLRYTPNLVSVFPFFEGSAKKQFIFDKSYFDFFFFISAERAGFEPAVPLPVRQFSKLFLSATQAPLLFLPCVSSLRECKYSNSFMFAKKNYRVC
jgi:hypothetical protein